MNNDKKIKWSEEELTEIVRSVPLCVLKDTVQMKRWASDNDYSDLELAYILTAVVTAMPSFRLVSFPSVESRRRLSTFGDLYDIYEHARVRMIIIHRVNYLLRCSMLTVYDLLERTGRLRFTAKKYYKQAERRWYDYELPRKQEMEESAWNTLQDHFVQMESLVEEGRERVYETIRDAMIRYGWKDIELKARIEIVFLLSKVCGYSYRAFFKDYVVETGADLSKCFVASDLSCMVDEFVLMVRSLGVGVSKDEHGFWCQREVLEDRSKRISAAWSHFMCLLQDDDLMDDAAREAIRLNPAVEAEYSRVVDEENRKMMDAAVSKLSDKFKVTRGNGSL